MAANALARYVAKPSAAIVLTTLNQQLPVLHKEGFQQSAPSQHWETIENAKILCIFVSIYKFNTERVNNNFS